MDLILLSARCRDGPTLENYYQEISEHNNLCRVRRSVKNAKSIEHSVYSNILQASCHLLLVLKSEDSSGFLLTEDNPLPVGQSQTLFIDFCFNRSSWNSNSTFDFS